MLNNETWFFRDSTPFAALAEHVIPHLLRTRGRHRPIHLWSAACSTGQEPYSIAMLLRQRYGSAASSFSILATDICEAALKRAEAGLYRQLEVNRGLPSAMLTRYFTRQGLYWRVKSEVSAMVSFRHVNLAAEWPKLPSVDVLFLRNVLIYFAAETRRQVLNQVRRVLRPDGYLFLGTAETPRDLNDAFRPVETGNSICYQPR
jgi:chemotaxis protein methyltransferase CheR